MILGSVRGDLHNIGKNMVALMLEVNGYEVVDLGADVSTRDFIERNGEMIEVDSRPSDAIALGVAHDTPIFVAEHVLDEVLADTMDLASQRESLQRRRGELTKTISRIQQQLEDKGFQETAGTGQIRTLQQHMQEMQAELDAIEEILRHID